MNEQLPQKQLAQSAEHRFSIEDLPDAPHAQQLRAGFPWLRFAPDLEAEFRRYHRQENLRYIRVSLVIGLLLVLAFSAIDAAVLGPRLSRLPTKLHLYVMVPLILLTLAASFTERGLRYFAPISVLSGTAVGLCVVAAQVIAMSGGGDSIFACMLIATIFLYFMIGLVFYNALAVNLILFAAYFAAVNELQLPTTLLAYNGFSLFAINLACAYVVYIHERGVRVQFLEANLLRDMVARDGLTGIRNRRMFDQHIQRTWDLATRERQRLAVFLIDIDCFKDYNDRYGHQAGDECLRAVAICLNQCARRPLDVVARYGGEEFGLVLYNATRDYGSEVLTRIQRSVAELNIAHEASSVANRLTVSIGAAFVVPNAARSHQGLVQLADEALYSAKEQGRNRVVVMEAEYHDLQTGRFHRKRAG